MLAEPLPQIIFLLPCLEDSSLRDHGSSNIEQTLQPVKKCPLPGLP